jgi:hypothetical protein
VNGQRAKKKRRLGLVMARVLLVLLAHCLALWDHHFVSAWCAFFLSFFLFWIVVWGQLHCPTERPYKAHDRSSQQL